MLVTLAVLMLRTALRCIVLLQLRCAPTPHRCCSPPSTHPSPLPAACPALPCPALPAVVDRHTTPSGAEYVRVVLGTAGGSATQVDDPSIVMDAEFLFLAGELWVTVVRRRAAWLASLAGWLAGWHACPTVAVPVPARPPARLPACPLLPAHCCCPPLPLPTGVSLK